jgi:integrative and conjugative element protein (TIGR02256 family)
MSNADFARRAAQRRAKAAKIATVISIGCPGCAAPPGVACRDHNGQLVDAHDVRRHAAAGALEALPAVKVPTARPSSSAAHAGRDVELREDAMAASPFRVTVSARAAEAMLEEARRADTIETGGLLAGVIGDGRIVVTDAGGPGPAAVRTRTSIKHDQQHNAKLAIQLARESGGQVRQFGTWHVHPSGALTPSAMDTRASAGMMHALTEVDGALPAFVDVIVAPDYLGSWSSPRASGWVTRRNGRRLVCEPVTLREID